MQLSGQIQLLDCEFCVWTNVPLTSSQIDQSFSFARAFLAKQQFAPANDAFWCFVLGWTWSMLFHELEHQGIIYVIKVWSDFYNMEKRHNRPLADMTNHRVGEMIAFAAEVCMTKWLHKWQRGWHYICSNAKFAKSLRLQVKLNLVNQSREADVSYGIKNSS